MFLCEKRTHIIYIKKHEIFNTLFELHNIHDIQLN